MRSRHHVLAKSLLVLLVGCGGTSDEASPTRPEEPNERPETALWPQVERFRSDLAAARHRSDGKGAVRIVDEPERVAAGGVGRWTLELVVSEEGIAEGGVITFMPEPYWGWSTPQAVREDLPGYTRVDVSREDVSLDAWTFGGAEAGMLVLTVENAALAGGDVVTLDYGAGAMGARADRYASREARLWVGVDGDGDGVRAMIVDSPAVDVAPREPERVVLLGPSVARPGETARYHVAALDGWANAAPEIDGTAWRAEVAIDGAPSDWTVPTSVALDERGRAEFDVVVGDAAEEAVRLRATLPLPEEAFAVDVANPLVVDADATRVIWGDLHGHTGLSDGTGTVLDYFTYARDTARLDVLALTDHDHYGPRFLDAAPEWWDHIQTVTTDFHAPGRFVTVLGYEWTSWIHGHRHVLYFSGEGEILSAIDQNYDTPFELWEALRGRAAMTLAHHSSGNPIPVNWSYPPDPELEPLTEIASVHGSSEARDAPVVVGGSREGQFVRDQLDRGYRLGFIGSGDSHDGHPGLPHLSPGYGWRPANARRDELVGSGGLAAIRSNELTRDAVLAALRARETYATSGPRIVALVERDTDASHLDVRLHGCAPIRAIDLVVGPAADSDGGASVRAIPLESGELDVSLLAPFPASAAYVYLRCVQVDGAAAWIGPFWR